ncbi:MAG: chorismate synthase [SAR324 cluster bacterium]|uniref:Chorismate synthase n=1 Tax=SAR324 cluster bacterium TaxID=2024889 RepID=A0A2A4SUA1_9DELT|nr:MAG: chorismate synthase [SAR324 cluster bacterium]
MGNSFGKFFNISTFGESHGQALGVIIDGCPAGLKISQEEIQYELDRRKPGQSKITTARAESDKVQILSGIYEGVTLGTAIGLMIPNADARSGAYSDLKDLYRPGHADYTYEARYGVRDYRGGGRASNRETAARVAAGAVAKVLLKELLGLETLAWVEQIHTIKGKVNREQVTIEQIESNIVRCPDQEAAEKMVTAIMQAKRQGNSIGGIIKFAVNGCPAGLGAPVFDKLTAELAKAMMSIPATRSVSFGLGEKASEMTGLEHNDPFVMKGDNLVGTETNNAGGILGGISNGEQIYGSLSFKPTATISSEQRTVSTEGQNVLLKARGRHDPCVLPRAVPIVEAMINLVLVDHLLQYSVASVDRLKRIFS